MLDFGRASHQELLQRRNEVLEMLLRNNKEVTTDEIRIANQGLSVELNALDQAISEREGRDRAEAASIGRRLRGPGGTNGQG